MACESRQLTLFTEDSLASPSPWLVSRKDGTTIDTYGLNFRGWSEKLGRFGWLLRTYLESCTLPLTTYARTWSVSATKSGFGILKLRLSERSTDGRELPLWPTPKSGDATAGMTAKTSGRPIEKATHLTTRVYCEEMFPTPRAADGMQHPLRAPENIGNPRGRLEDHVALYPTPRACSGDRSSGANRTEFYEAFKMFPTATAQDASGSRNTTARRSKQSPNWKCCSNTLTDHVTLFPTPTAQDAKNNAAPSQHERNSAALNVVAGGSLNPAWVEWLMGFPPNWTDLEHDEVPTDLDGLEEWWRSEPAGLPRVAHGVKDRVARLKALGNAVDPRWARPIFRAICCVESACRGFTDGREEDEAR